MKKLFLFLLIGSASLMIYAQDIKEIPLDQLTFINSNFDKSQNKVTFKGGKWNSSVKLPTSANREVSKYKSMVIEIPQSTVMIRIRFIGEDGKSKEFYQPIVKSELNRKLNLALVPLSIKYKK